MQIFAIWNGSRSTTFTFPACFGSDRQRAITRCVLGTACLRKFGEILNQLVEVINAAIPLPILIPTKPRRNTREKIHKKRAGEKIRLITFKTLLNFFRIIHVLKNFNGFIFF